MVSLIFLFVACSINYPDRYFNLAKFWTHENIIHDYFFVTYREGYNILYVFPKTFKGILIIYRSLFNDRCAIVLQQILT